LKDNPSLNKFVFTPNPQPHPKKIMLRVVASWIKEVGSGIN